MSGNIVLSLLEVMLALIAWFVSGRIASITSKALISEMASPPFGIILHRSIYIPLLLLALYSLRRFFGGWSLGDLGFRRGEGFKINLRDGLIAFAAISLASLPFLAALMSNYASQMSAYGEAMREMNVLTLILMFLAYSPVVLIDSPIHEEVFFRGYYQGMLSERYDPTVGVLTSTLFFGLQHAFGHPEWHPGMVAATVPVGFILALTYHRTKSLISVITPHFLLNFLLTYPMVFYAAGHISIVILAFLAIALASIIILMLHKHRVRDIFSDGLKYLDLNPRSLIMVSLFTALSLAFSYLATTFRYSLG